MNRKIFTFLFLATFLTPAAQTVTLRSHQDYIPVITQVGDTLISSITEGNQWYKDDVPIDGATGRTFISTGAGVYKVVATYAETGCSSSSELFRATSSIRETDAGMLFHVYPNPGDGNFYIQFTGEEAGNVRIELFSMNGKLAFATKATVQAGQTIRFGNSSLPGGTYSLRVTTAKGIAVKTLIVL